MYDYPATRYAFGNQDFGGGANVLMYLKGPKGKAGLLFDYGVFGLSEAFAAGTTTPMMSVGTIADPDYYGDEFDFGALAINAGGKSVRETHYPGSAGFTSKMLIREIPADSVVMVTLVAGTGSGLTGQAVPFVDIKWAN